MKNISRKQKTLDKFWFKFLDWAMTPAFPSEREGYEILKERVIIGYKLGPDRKSVGEPVHGIKCQIKPSDYNFWLWFTQHKMRSKEDNSKEKR